MTFAAPAASYSSITPTIGTLQTLLTTTATVPLPAVGTGVVSFALNVSSGSAPASPYGFSYILTAASDSAITTGVQSLQQAQTHYHFSINNGSVTLPFVCRGPAIANAYFRVVLYTLTATWSSGTIQASSLRIVIQG